MLGGRYDQTMISHVEGGRAEFNFNGLVKAARALKVSLKLPSWAYGRSGPCRESDFGHSIRLPSRVRIRTWRYYGTAGRRRFRTCVGPSRLPARLADSAPNRPEYVQRDRDFGRSDAPCPHGRCIDPDRPLARPPGTRSHLRSALGGTDCLLGGELDLDGTGIFGATIPNFQTKLGHPKQWFAVGRFGKEESFEAFHGLGSLGNTRCPIIALRARLPFRLDGHGRAVGGGCWEQPPHLFLRQDLLPAP